MKQIFTQCAAYNLWANTQFAEVINGITPSYFDREIESSFPSIRKTINHIRSAEYIWLQRMQANSLTEWPGINLAERPKEVAAAWVKGSEILAIQIERLKDADFEKYYPYSDMKGIEHKDLLSTMLMQVFTHSTFHRGQLVTLFRQSGITNIPRTDYIAYSRGINFN
ncbi:damage-inducible protein DinB [soil metagenome]